MGGTPEKVLRIASAGALVVLVAAGCGGSARPHHSAARGVPRVLAHAWATQASAIAKAAAAGDSCRAHTLAGTLRDEVINAGGRVPLRLRTPLLDGVNSLANRAVCTPPAPAPTTKPAPKPAPKPTKHPPHKDDHDGHGHHGHGGDKKEKG